MQRVSQDITYASTGGAFFGWLYQQDWLLIISAMCSVLGLIFTVYFKYKDDKRKQTEFEFRLARDYGMFKTGKFKAGMNKAGMNKSQETSEDEDAA